MIAPPEVRDERLAEVLAGLVEAQKCGRRADLEGAARAHPDLADELRELWAVAQFAELAQAFRTPRSGVVAPDGLHPSPDDTPRPEVDRPPPLPREFGDYVLLKELGRGGMGVVYQARQKSLNRVVAIKMVREAHLATPADRARFRAEAEAAARLHHPNIVTVYEVGAADGQAYFCMEYVAGETLATRVVEAGPMPGARPRAWWASSPAPSTTPTNTASCTAT